MKTLRLSSDLTLPIDAVTQAIGILAKRRAGKSYLARRLAEQLFKAGQQIVIVDPKGDWWGIRSSADGKSPGLPVVILGGERGDVPLEVNAGEVVAKLVTEERVSVLLDLSLFRKHEVTTFMTAFLENLYRLKAKEIYRTPLMLFIDEADAIAPQKPQETQARMLGAAEDIVRRGGQRGIGCTLITQRSAVLNKNVLTQVEMMVALRTIAPQDLKAMDAWIEVHGEKEQRDTLMASLPALPDGDAWFWSPGWPTRDGLFKRTHVAKIETFDSGATPKSGEKRVEPKNLADVDLDSLTRQMAATIEKAKADDPKELKKKLAEQERRIRQLEAAKPAKAPAGKQVDQGAVDRAVKTGLREQASSLTKLKSALEAAMKFIINISTKNFDVAGVDKAELEKAIGAAVERANALVDRRLQARANDIEQLRLSAQRIAANLKAILEDQDVVVNVEVTRNEPFTVAPHRISAPRREPGPSGSSTNGNLAKGEKIVLTAIAQYPEGADRNQVTVLTGYKRSTRDTYIQRLSGAGFVEADGALVRPTPAGIDALGSDYEPLPEGDDLQAYWLGRLPEGERRVLEALLPAYPDGVPRDDISELTGYKRSTRDTYIQRMKSRRLVEDTSGGVRASPNLFSESR